MDGSSVRGLGLLGGSAAVVSLFLPWYEEFFGVSITALDAEFFAWGGAVASAVGGFLVATARSPLARPRALVALAASAAGVGMVALQFLTKSDFVRFGLVVGLLGGALSLASAVASWQSRRRSPGTDDRNPARE